MLLPELVAVALPPWVVVAEKPLLSLPELVAVALPPSVVLDEKPLAVRELVVVAFRFGALAIFGKGLAAVALLLQVMWVAVVVHMNCADAG